MSAEAGRPPGYGDDTLTSQQRAAANSEMGRRIARRTTDFVFPSREGSLTEGLSILEGLDDAPPSEMINISRGRKLASRLLAHLKR